MQALLGLLDERSVLLRCPPLDEHADALYLVAQLARDMMRHPVARVQLLHAHEPSGATPLLRVLAVIVLYIIPCSDCKFAAGVALSAFRLAQGFSGDVNDDEDASSRSCTFYAGVFEFEPLAVQQLARRCGWNEQPGAAFMVGATVYVPDESRPAHAAVIEMNSSTWTHSPLQDAGSLRSRCAACERREREDEAPFKKCARCRTVPYCCAACLEAHWPVHKRVCKR